MNLKGYLIIGGIIIVIASAFYVTHRSSSQIINNLPKNITTQVAQHATSNQQTQAPVTNQQTEAIQTSLKTLLENEFANPITGFQHYVYAVPWPATTIRDVKVTQQSDGSYNVHIDFNASPDSNSLSGGLGIYSDMQYIYYPIYTEYVPQHKLNINNLSVTEWTNETNKYGNTVDSTLVTTSVSKSDADQTNWQDNDFGGLLEGLLNCSGQRCANTAPGPAIQ